MGRGVYSAGLACRARGEGIPFVEVFDDTGDRPVQAVEVEPVEPDTLRQRPIGVVTAQPAQKADDLTVAPHPPRDPREVAKRRFRRVVIALHTHPAIRAIGIRPVGLRGDDGESAALDEQPRQIRPQAVKLVRAVCRLANQDYRDAFVDGVEEPAGGALFLQHPCMLTHDGNG